MRVSSLDPASARAPGEGQKEHRERVGERDGLMPEVADSPRDLSCASASPPTVSAAPAGPHPRSERAWPLQGIRGRRRVVATLVTGSFVDSRVRTSRLVAPGEGEQVRALQAWIADQGLWGVLASDDRVLVGLATPTPAVRCASHPAPEHSGCPPRSPLRQARVLGVGRRGAAGGARYDGCRPGRVCGDASVCPRRPKARVASTRAKGFVVVGEPFDFGLGSVCP